MRIDINTLNIRAAAHRGDLRLIERKGRFGAYVSIQDKHGTIEVSEDMGEANRRVQGALA